MNALNEIAVTNCSVKYEWARLGLEAQINLTLRAAGDIAKSISNDIRGYQHISLANLVFALAQHDEFAVVNISAGEGDRLVLLLKDDTGNVHPIRLPKAKVIGALVQELQRILPLAEVYAGIEELRNE